MAEDLNIELKNRKKSAKALEHFDRITYDVPRIPIDFVEKRERIRLYFITRT